MISNDACGVSYAGVPDRPEEMARNVPQTSPAEEVVRSQDDQIDGCPNVSELVGLLSIWPIDIGRLSSPFYNEKTQEATRAIPAPLKLSNSPSERVKQVPIVN